MTREDLKNYCLRKLGEPLNKINISLQQIEDRIDDALDYFTKYHNEGREELYLKHKITASKITFTNLNGQFSKYETIIGQSSDATTTFIDNSNTEIRCYKTAGTFQIGETIVGLVSGATAVVSAFALGDVDNKWIPISDHILSVVRILPIRNFATDQNDGLFNIEYQFMMDSLSHFTNIDMTTYFLYKQHLALIQKTFSPERSVRFSRLTNQLYIDMEWNKEKLVDRYIIVQCYAIADPEKYKRIYTDRWLRDYTSALIKLQWGTNLKKFSGLQLPGGVTLNGQDLFDEAKEEIKELEEQLRTIHRTPPRFFVG